MTSSQRFEPWKTLQHYAEAGERAELEAFVEALGPSEAFRGAMDYYAHGRNTGAILARLAAEKPTTLACMHGSAWSGDGAALLRQLAESVG